MVKVEREKSCFTTDLEQTFAVHLSILYKDKGDWNKATECLEHSLKILERQGDERGMITVLNTEGFLYKASRSLER